MHTALRPLLVLVALSLGLSSLLAGPVEDGEEAMRRGEAEVALRFFKVGIKADPDDERAWAGYEKATRALAGEPSAAPAVAPGVPRAVEAPPSPPDPAQADVPLARFQDAATTDVQTNIKAGPTNEATVDRYLRGEPIFYSDGFKRLMTGRRVKDIRPAQARYDQEKEELTRYYTRKFDGRLGVSATLFTPRLYAFLACARSAEKKLGEKGAEEYWLKEGDLSFRTLEFYLVVKNLTYKGGVQGRPQRLDIAGIENRVFLEDDRGTRYLPYKTRAPASARLKELDNFTVWFAPVARDGTPIWENAVSELRLVLEGQPGEAQRIVFPFQKTVFRRMVQVGS